MVRHIDLKFGRYDAVLFLVLWWLRYGTLTDIVGWCDWLDRRYLFSASFMVRRMLFGSLSRVALGDPCPEAAAYHLEVAQSRSDRVPQIG